MTWTLWSRNELVGESELDYVRVMPNLRTGDLHPTPRGLLVLERLTQTRADISDNLRRQHKNTSEARDDETLRADLAAQSDLYEGAALELRAADGSVIPTVSIDVTDTHYLLAPARECEEDDAMADDGLESDIDGEALTELEERLAQFDGEYPPWAPDVPEREPARFQLYVRLANDWAIP
jgi:hypothetical protein